MNDGLDPVVKISAPRSPFVAIRPIGPRQLADFQGHNLLAAKVAARLGVRHLGWSGSLVQRMIARLCRKLAPFRGLGAETIWHLLVGDLLLRCGGRVHWTWGDDFAGRTRYPGGAIFTMHQPMELWPEPLWTALERSGGVLTMAQRERDALRSRYPVLPVEFIPHGVDTDFWQPDSRSVRERPKVISAVGRYLRNYEMLIRVASALLASDPELVVRWLVNPEFVLPSEVAAKLPAERFQLVRNLSAVELRDFYRESWLFFMPYNNVTASNAIVEVMACGVPVFTTRVGGMESYAQDAAVLVENNDDRAMIAAITECLRSRERREALSTAARAVAVRSFSWPIVIERHLNFYGTLARSRMARERFTPSGV
jgi:glycosyltransferase involved in cell wall biosynthesis